MAGYRQKQNFGSILMLKGIFWDLFEKISNQGISFGISILLARLLSPAEFGLIGMVMVFVGMSQVFLDMGLSSALVQRQQVNEVQYSSVFYLNIAIGLALTLLLYFSSGLIAAFYERPELIPICKALSLLFVLDSFIIVQNAQFAKVLDLKKPAIIRVIATLISGSVGVMMAFNGFGVWSLVTQSLLAAFIFVVGVWFVSSWRPVLKFEFQTVKELWGYSSKLFFSGFLDATFTRLDVLVIGKLFSANTLGYYTRAQSFNYLIIQYTSGSLARVFFPVISRIQHNTAEVREIYEKAITVISFMVFGLLGFFFLCAEDIFVLLFSAKWLPAVKFFKILLLAGYAYPLSSIMVGVLSGRGQSGKFLKLEILKKILMLAAFGFGFMFGITGFLYALVIVMFLSVLLNMYFVQNEIDYSLLKQFSIIFQYFIVAAIAVAIVYFAGNWFSNNRFWYTFQAGLLFTVGYLLLNLSVKAKAISLLITKFNEKTGKAIL
jgi:teichuronic acid exporter